MRRGWLIVGLLAVVAAALCAVAIALVAPWFYHPLGRCAGTPHQQMLCEGYNSWSGIFGSFLTSLPGWLVALGIYYRHHNCAALGCPRIGKHQTADGLHKLCRRCHPDLPDHKLSLAEIHERHHAALPRRDP